MDVRDMVCAQALAVVARAVEALSHGACLKALYNADDVKRDLLVWARERGLAAVDDGSMSVRIHA